MKLQGKILLSTLPMLLLSFILAAGITYYLSRDALKDIGIQWLETRSDEALKIATEQDKYLREYGLDSIEASVKQAQIDTTTMMSNIVVGREGYVLVIDDNGKIVDHPNQDLVGTDIRNEPWFSKLSENDRGALSYRFKNSEYLASYHRFEPWNWYIIVTDPTSELFGVVNRLGWYVLVLGLVGSILITVVLVLLMRRVTAPLVTLVAGAEKVGEGKLDTRIDITTRDEVGVLSSAFNDMIDQLRALYDRLEERLATIVSNAPIILFSVDAKGVITLLEGKGLDDLGMDPIQLIGKNVEEVFAHAPEFINSVRKAQQGETVNEIVDFGELNIEVWCSLTDKNSSQDVIGVTTDLTERIQAEKNLVKQNHLLESVSVKLSKYLSPQVYSSIFSGKQRVEISSKRKKLTVFFSDIANFTETTDKMESEDLTHLLNHYLTEMANIALEYGATIDKYIGDAILIFFGDPETKGVREDALTCVKMAIAMRKRMLELESDWLKAGIESPLRCRIGINTGYCTVGNFGSEDRMDYTIIGGGVNLASRLETAAEPGEILISYETYANVRDEINCMKSEEISVKGLAYSVATYRVLDEYNMLESSHQPLREELPNLRLEMDADSMTEAQRSQAAEILKEALNRLSSE